MDFEGEAQSLLRHVGLCCSVNAPTSPVSFRVILKRLNIRYRTLPLDPTIDGVLTRRSRNTYITINSRRPRNRRRFSIGHELGHWALGHPDDVSVIGDDRLKEVQANRFSGSLLMPADAIYEKHKWLSSIHEIARWFRVSDISAAIRLRRLGLRECECDIVISEYWTHQGDGDFSDESGYAEVAVTHSF
jgi:Zn-dependent peptidase ImmA (M78 family)